MQSPPMEMHRRDARISGGCRSASPREPADPRLSQTATHCAIACAGTDSAPVAAMGAHSRGRPPAAPRAASILPAMRRAGLFLDGTLVASGVELRVHRAVVSALSPFFAAAFAGGFAESASARLEIRDATPESVAALVRFAYGEPPLPSHASLPLALDVLALAHRLGVPALPEAAAAVAADRARVEEYVVAFHAAVRYGCPAAAGEVFRKMATEYEGMQKEGVIWQLTASELDALVRSRDLVAEEKTLLRGIAAWTRADVDRRRGELDTILLNIRLQRPCRGRTEAVKTIFGVPGG